MREKRFVEDEDGYLRDCLNGEIIEYDVSDRVIDSFNSLSKEIQKLTKKIKRQSIIIKNLTIQVEKLIEETEIAQLLQNEYDKTEQLEEELKKANAFIVHKGLELEFIKWCRE